MQMSKNKALYLRERKKTKVLVLLHHFLAPPAKLEKKKAEFIEPCIVTVINILNAMLN